MVFGVFEFHHWLKKYNLRLASYPPGIHNPRNAERHVARIVGAKFISQPFYGVLKKLSRFLVW